MCFAYMITYWKVIMHLNLLYFSSKLEKQFEHIEGLML